MTRVLLGVTGGVGAFKAVLLLRLLRKSGFDVRVLLTESAARFVGRPTFHALSGAPVYDNLWALDRSQSGELHVELSSWADAMLIYPATANCIGGLAAGLADDLLKLSLSCFEGPVILCPAMHSRMAASPGVEEATAVLAQRGVRVLEPAEGELASGEHGRGRLREPEEALEALRAALAPADLEGRRVVVTAGPTREHIDPVRFLSNPSSGRMGVAVARVAARRGARVDLLVGPGVTNLPEGVSVHPFVSAADLGRAITDCVQGADVVVMAAAVADWSSAEVAEHKLSKSDGSLSLDLQRTEDILARLGGQADPPLLVGFAMETQDLVPRAQAKLEAKNLDLLVANDLTTPGAGFQVATNVVTLLDRDGGVEALPLMSKEDVAERILDRVAKLLE